jgi:hypothetical protein
VPSPPPIAERSPLIGRVSELARVDHAFVTGARVVSLVGPPGIGKTRLARHVAQRRHACGWCALAGTRTLSDLLATVAEALSIPMGAAEDRAVLERIGLALAARGPAPLLVLDNADGSPIPSPQPSTRGSSARSGCAS